MKNLFHLGRDAEDDDAAEPFDPAPALERLGFAVPEELPPREDEEPETEGFIAKPVLDAYREGTDLPADLSVFMTADHAEEAQAVEDEAAAAPAPTPAGINPKDALGMLKPDLSLIPPAALLYEAQGMMDGAAKYGPYNWRDNPVKARVYIAAAMRHLQQYLDGEDFDPISGVHHLGHARCCMGILADATETGNLVDDRPTKGAAGDMIRRFNDTQSFRR